MKQYNNKEAKKIITDTDDSLLLRKLEEYLEYYPNDIITTRYYLNKLLRTNNFEKYKSYVNGRLERRIVNMDLRNYLIIKKFSILLNLGEYQEAYNLYKEENYVLSKSISKINVIECYLLKKCNIPFNGEERYIYNQIFNYNEEIALNYVINRHQKNNDKTSIFNNNCNVNDLFYFVKDNINDENARFTDFIFKKYIFRYEGIGVNQEGKKANFIKVICLRDNNEIITMYPICESEVYDMEVVVDLTPIVENTYTNKLVKRSESQAEKFIKKFGYR